MADNAQNGMSLSLSADGNTITAGTSPSLNKWFQLTRTPGTRSFVYNALPAPSYFSSPTAVGDHIVTSADTKVRATRVVDSGDGSEWVFVIISNVISTLSSPCSGTTCGFGLGLAMSQDGSRLAVAETLGKQVHLYRRVAGGGYALSQTIPSPSGAASLTSYATAIELSPDGSVLVFNMDTATTFIFVIYKFDSSSRSFLLSYTSPALTAPATSFAVTPDNNLVLTGLALADYDSYPRNGVVIQYLYDMNSQQWSSLGRIDFSFRFWDGEANLGRSLAISGDGLKIAVGGSRDVALLDRPSLSSTAWTLIFNSAPEMTANPDQFCADIGISMDGSVVVCNNWLAQTGPYANVGKLHVLYPVFYSSNPMDNPCARVGDTITLSVSATNMGTIQWQSSTNGNRWVDIPSANSATFSKPAAAATDLNKFYRTEIRGTSHPSIRHRCSDVLNGQSPPGTPVITTSTGTAPRKLQAINSISSCEASYPAPSISPDSGSYVYNTYTFTAPASECVSIQFLRGNEILVNVYVGPGGFDANAPDTNLVGWMGTVLGFSTMYFNTVAHQQYTVVVMDNVSGPSGSAYTMLLYGEDLEGPFYSNRARISTDITRPSITCPSSLTRNTDFGQCAAGAVVYPVQATATDNCAIASTTYSPTSGSRFVLGVTTVTATTIDPSGNSATCTFRVTVLDNQKPIINCPESIEVRNVPCNPVVTYSAITASDNCGGSPSITKLGGLASGASFPLGTTIQTYQADDSRGNTDTCSFAITVSSCYTLSQLAMVGGSTTVQINEPFTLSIRYTHSANGQVMIYVDFTGDGISDNHIYASDPSETYFANWAYSSEGQKCVRTCVTAFGDNSCSLPGAFDAYPCVGSGKRSSAGQSILITVLAASGGDPFFIGFDGVKFEFVGKVGHAYNYISSPTVQLNGLIDLGLDASGNNMMNTVTRKIGLIWHDEFSNAQNNSITNHLLSYSVDRFGTTEISVYFDEAGEWKVFNNSLNKNAALDSAASDPVIFYVGGARLEWTVNVLNNQSRQTLQMHPHQLTSQLKFRTRLYELNVFSVEYVDQLLAHDSKTGHFHFLDLEFGRLADKLECLEGVWGRTSCPQQHNNNYELSMYDLNGRVFGTSFPFSSV